MNKFAILIASMMVFGAIAQLCYAGNYPSQYELQTEEDEENGLEPDDEELEGGGWARRSDKKTFGKGWFSDFVKTTPSDARRQVGVSAEDEYAMNVRKDGMPVFAKPREAKCLGTTTKDSCQFCCETKENGAAFTFERPSKLAPKKVCSCQRRDVAYGHSAGNE